MFAKKNKNVEEEIEIIDNDGMMEADQVKKKKKLPGWFIIVILGAMFGIAIIASALSKPKDKAGAMALNVIEVQTSDVTEILNTSGLLESENKKVIYSPVNAKVLISNAKVGMAVKKGDKLITFDTTDLERNNQQQQLTALASQYGNQDTIEKSNQTAQKSAEAGAEADNIQAQVDVLQAETNQLMQQVANEGGGTNKTELGMKVNELENKRTQLEESKRNIQNNVNNIDSETAIKNSESSIIMQQLQTQKTNQTLAEAALDSLTSGTPEYIEKKAELEEIKKTIEKLNTQLKDIGERLAQLGTELKATEATIQDLNTQLHTVNTEYAKIKAEYDAMPASTQAQIQLEQKSQELMKLQGELTAAQGKSESLRSGVMTAAQYNAMSTNSNLAELSVLTAEELVQRGMEGITAEFDGVIATAPIVEGGMATQGSELFTIVSNSQVGVKIEVSANDYEKLKVGNKAKIKIADKTYDGEVKVVDKIATKNEKGNSVICAYVHINNPDADICIGVSGKVTMTVAEAKNVVAIPSEVINTSTKGEFVYIVEGGVVKKIQVTLGLASDKMVEITKGLKKGDQIVSDIGLELKEGMKATITPENNTDAKNTDK